MGGPIWRQSWSFRLIVNFCAVLGCSNRSNREKDKGYCRIPAIVSRSKPKKQAWSNMADESITFELGRHVNDIIGLIERNTCQCDFIQFRLDWRTRSSSFACSCKLRLKREVLTETLTFTLSKQFCRFLNENHYSFSRGNIVTITHKSIIQPVETELYKIALISI